MRLNKFLAKSGVASRRKSDELIKMATTSVNNEIILDPAYEVSEIDQIRFDGKLLKIDKEKISSPIVKGQNLYVTKNNSIIKLN